MRSKVYQLHGASSFGGLKHDATVAPEQSDLSQRLSTVHIEELVPADEAEQILVSSCSPTCCPVRKRVVGFLTLKPTLSPVDMLRKACLASIHPTLATLPDMHEQSV